jgi:hypothetical protein
MLAGNTFGAGDRNRAHRDVQRTAAQPLIYSFCSAKDRLKRRIIGEHGDDDFTISGRSSGARREDCARIDQTVGFFRGSIPDCYVVACPYQIGGDSRTHVAKTYKADFHG